MRTFLLPLLLFLAAALAGCTSVQRAANLEFPRLAQFKLNSAAGMYQDWQADYASSQRNEFLATFERTYVSDQWAPVIAFCVREYAAEKNFLCLLLTTSRNGHEGYTIVESSIDGKRQVLSSNNDRIVFNPTQPVRVRIDATPEGLEFKVDGLRAYLSKGWPALNMLKLGCSSAACTIDTVE